MLRAISLSVLLVIYPIKMKQQFSSRVAVWNVGQGQWVTMVRDSFCLHIDMGGEHWPIESLTKLCKNKINAVAFTHGDWDHISFIHRFNRKVSPLCRLNTPREKLKNSRRNFIRRIPNCTRPTKQLVKSEIYELPTDPGTTNDANDFSRIYILAKHWLIPGDSTKFMERQWARRLLGKKITHLVLGHHGSNTSSANALLQRLPHLSLAIVSARKKRYGHPHPKVVKRLRKKKMPLLKTEHWGHIQVETEMPR